VIAALDRTLYKVGGLHHVGACFLALKARLQELRSHSSLFANRGKKDERSALSPIESHRVTALRKSAFVASRINCKEKTKNLPRFAGELNLARLGVSAEMLALQGLNPPSHDETSKPSLELKAQS
jgi:hypothetical protein